MRLLYVGDVFGQPGREAARYWLPRLRAAWQLTAIVVNGENAAQDGRGITPAAARGLLQAGADVVTGGNHSFRCPDIVQFMAGEPRLVRPLNWRQAGAAGSGQAKVVTAKGALYVLQVQGQVFMPQQCSDPFASLDAALWELPAGQAILVDVHAEASSEKQALAWHVAGRASAVVGSHTHVPTADARLLANYTAYQTDAGMCGPYESVIGSEASGAVARLRGQGSAAGALEVATGDVRLCGAVIDVDAATGGATGIWPVQLPYPEPPRWQLPAVGPAAS